MAHLVKEQLLLLIFDQSANQPKPTETGVKTKCFRQEVTVGGVPMFSVRQKISLWNIKAFLTILVTFQNKILEHEFYKIVLWYLSCMFPTAKRLIYFLYNQI